MFEFYYDQVIDINPLLSVMNILNIHGILNAKINNKDFSIINFDGEEFMKFHKYFVKVYLYNRDNKVFTKQMCNVYYKTMIISLQVDYCINEIENYSSIIIKKEYKQIGSKVDFEMNPLEIISNFFVI